MATNEPGKKGKGRGKGKKKAGTAFGDLQKFYEITNKIHRYRVYKLFSHVPDPFIAGFSHLLAKVFFGTSKKLVMRMRRSVHAVTGKNYPPSFVRKVADANLKNMGTLLVDLMLKAPNYDGRNYTRVVKFEGLEHLEKALSLGKGALVPSIHVGQFFHCLGGLLLKGYEMAAVGNMKNRLVFEGVMGFPQYRKLHAVPRDSYEKIQANLIQHLKKNRIVFLMHDIARAHNLRTPFIRGQKDFLVPTPQGIVALQRETGAPIVPIVSIPQDRFTRSIVKVLDPSGIQNAIDQHRDDPPEIFHGHVSTAINKEIFPYILQYPHCYEELTGIGSFLLDLAIKLPRKASLLDVIGTIEKDVDALIRGSFEPGRADPRLLEWLGTGWKHGKDFLANGGGVEFTLPTRASIKIGGRVTSEQLSKILAVLATLLRRAGLSELGGYYMARRGEIPSFFAPPSGSSTVASALEGMEKNG
jgi:lauroyl/myristoyl acyltransferase